MTVEHLVRLLAVKSPVAPPAKGHFVLVDMSPPDERSQSRLVRRASRFASENLVPSVTQAGGDFDCLMCRKSGDPERAKNERAPSARR
jgi:hypothetical protein